MGLITQDPALTLPCRQHNVFAEGIAVHGLNSGASGVFLPAFFHGFTQRPGQPLCLVAAPPHACTHQLRAP